MPKRAKRKGATPAEAEAALQPENDDGTTMQTSVWVDLPFVALCSVFAMLNLDDLVSAGQTCRAWRVVAKDPVLWKHRKLEYWPESGSARNHAAYYYRGLYFSRAVRFAPCLDLIRCNAGMEPAARMALCKQSQCKPRAVEMRGSNVSTFRYLEKWRDSIEEVTLVNPSEAGFRAVAALPRLVTLCIWDNQRDRRYMMPPFPVESVPPNPTLKRLVFSEAVDEVVRNAMVQAYAASLEEIRWPQGRSPEALPKCVALRRFTVELDPVADGNAFLAQLLERHVLGGSLLEQLRFESLDVHDKTRCATFRNTIREDRRLTEVDCSIECSSCERGYAIYPDLHHPGHYL